MVLKMEVVWVIEDVVALMTPEEDAALQDLCDALVVNANNRVRSVIRRMCLKGALEMFEIEVRGLTFGITVDKNTRKYLLKRKEELGLGNVKKSLDYFG